MLNTLSYTDKNSCLTALVGRLGSAPLAAVGLSGALFNFCNFLFSFLMVVTTPKVAAAVARRDLDKVAMLTAYALNTTPPALLQSYASASLTHYAYSARDLHIPL